MPAGQDGRGRSGGIGSTCPARTATIAAVTFWADLSPEERFVFLEATEEGYLNGVIGAFLGHAEHGGAVWIFSSDIAAMRPLIPRFRAVVRDMISRGWIEIREPHTGVWNDAPALSPAQIDAVLADPATWLPSETGEHRMIMVMPTDHGDVLIGRLAPTQPPEPHSD
jgi:hypothetical protein